MHATASRCSAAAGQCEKRSAARTHTRTHLTTLTTISCTDCEGFHHGELTGVTSYTPLLISARYIVGPRRLSSAVHRSTSSSSSPSRAATSRHHESVQRRAAQLLQLLPQQARIVMDDRGKNDGAALLQICAWDDIYNIQSFGANIAHHVTVFNVYSRLIL